mmetsp:Transcript_108785/g.198098  ORF Transcript_108785/g.198098 Transcript_108785/m.198098 type:complete len:174 (+) Transcript_108785:180-701(+)
MAMACVAFFLLLSSMAPAAAAPCLLALDGGYADEKATMCEDGALYRKRIELLGDGICKESDFQYSGGETVYHPQNVDCNDPTCTVVWTQAKDAIIERCFAGYRATISYKECQNHNWCEYYKSVQMAGRMVRRKFSLLMPMAVGAVLVIGVTVAFLALRNRSHGAENTYLSLEA